MEDIKQFIYKHIGKTRITLDRNTRLFKDLKIDGDDAAELLEDFSSTYNVDISCFKFDEYFSPEGIDIIGAIVGFLKNRPPLKELTIGDLEKAITVGRLQ